MDNVTEVTSPSPVNTTEAVKETLSLYFCSMFLIVFLILSLCCCLLDISLCEGDEVLLVRQADWPFEVLQASNLPTNRVMHIMESTLTSHQPTPEEESFQSQGPPETQDRSLLSEEPESTPLSNSSEDGEQVLDLEEPPGGTEELADGAIPETNSTKNSVVIDIPDVDNDINRPKPTLPSPPVPIQVDHMQINEKLEVNGMPIESTCLESFMCTGTGHQKSTSGFSLHKNELTPVDSN